MKTRYEIAMNNKEEGFETPRFGEEVNYHGVGGRVISPKLCSKMKEYSDCPYNEIREACLDCDIILRNSEEQLGDLDLGYADSLGEDE